MLVTIYMRRLQQSLFTLLMILAAVCWLIGNVLLFLEWAIFRVVPWWISFLMLVILGERIDLTRFQKSVRWAEPLLKSILLVFLGGLVLNLVRLDWGECLVGASLLGFSF